MDTLTVQYNTATAITDGQNIDSPAILQMAAKQHGNDMIMLNGKMDSGLISVR